MQSSHLVINTPKVVGVYPDTDFVLKIAASGSDSLSYSASGLPKGLSVSSDGVITGRIASAGEYDVTLKVSDSIGSRRKDIRIVAGDTLALTPPLGWMTWNMFGANISQQLIIETADAMVEYGLVDVGYDYIIIDDLWCFVRDGEGRMVPDKKKFPDGMQFLADYCHSKGIRLGIYSDAANKTCAGAMGSLANEVIDAKTFAGWRIDYLKYDYCNAPGDRETAIKRYTEMADALKDSGRSIVFGVCEWGVRKPWLWGKDAGGHLWRTTYDIRDSWSLYKKTGGLGILDILDKQVGLSKYAGPGHWNDPDMLVVGLNGQGDSSNAYGAKGCTDTEYRSQMSLWCLLSAPMLISCDIRELPEATWAILTNTKAIAINQDPLGRVADRIYKDGDKEIWSKQLADGSYAAGLLNRSDKPLDITLDFKLLGLSGECEVIDLWDSGFTGRYSQDFTAKVKAHEVVLVKIRGC
ncbi:MAG: putative Ig domain-containing protein [Anaerohalosphaera sp.]|nr:putative Ig domain-containing protein [Anaerohalosphaera sp.]